MSGPKLELRKDLPSLWDERDTVPPPAGGDFYSDATVVREADSEMLAQTREAQTSPPAPLPRAPAAPALTAEALRPPRVPDFADTPSAPSIPSVLNPVPSSIPLPLTRETPPGEARPTPAATTMARRVLLVVALMAGLWFLIVVVLLVLRLLHM